MIVIAAGPEYAHHLVNPSKAPMRYLSLSTQERPEVCVDPDPGKTGAFAKDHRVMVRSADSLDCWGAEP